MFVLVGSFSFGDGIMAKDYNTGEFYWSSLSDKQILYFKRIEYAKKFLENLKMNNDIIYDECNGAIKIAKIALEFID
jgi:hypothetical protein